MKGVCALVLLLCPLGYAPSLLGQPVVAAVVNGASFEAVVSPGCLVSIFGERLARSRVAAQLPLPLPETLESTTVRVNGKIAPLYFVSPSQINAQLPYDIAPGRVSLVVTTVEGSSNLFMVDLVSTSPGVFTRAMNGRGQALYFDPHFQLGDAVAPGDVLIVYATGLGATDPTGVAGESGSSAEPFQRVVDPLKVFIGEAEAEVAFAGLAPGFAGVYQVNIVAPSGLATDRVVLKSAGRQSNATNVSIQGGQDVSNAQGTIEAVFPLPETTVTFSPVPVVVRFSARFDISLSAGPFHVVAVSETGSCVVSFNPPSNSFDGSLTVPTAQTRAFNFNGTEITVIDLLANGLPIPGNVVPLNRIDPAIIQAFDLLPLPNMEVPGSATSLFRFAGQAAPGSAFTIDDTNNSLLSTFVGFLPVPYNPGQKDRSTPLLLYVDGKLIASAEVNFKTP